MAFLPDLVIENMAKAGEPRRPRYERVLRHCYCETPPFARRFFSVRYHELARDPEWFANSLVANAALEGYGATQIWKFSNKLRNPVYAASVRQHSLDESRHSTMFVRMLDLTFPGLAIAPDARARINDLQPHYTNRSHPEIATAEQREDAQDDSWVLRELIQVHITEIRALILQHLLRPVLLHYAPTEAVGRLSAASNCLIRDESRHIGYSAAFFDAAIEQGGEDFMIDAFERHAAEFNELTLEELERDKIEV